MTDATAFCGVATVSHLAFSRVLAESVSRIYPGQRLNVVVIDDRDRDHDSASEPFDVVRPEELDLEPTEFWSMAACYEPVEMACALKPWAIKHQLDTGARTVIYVDGDTLLVAPLEGLAEAAFDCGVALVPHITESLPLDGMKPIEAEFLRFGTFNGGCLGVGNNEGGRRFLRWWAERLRRDCIHSDEEGLYLDQRWLDLVPSLFDPALVRDGGVDVAYWNRAGALEWVGGEYSVSGQPLRLFHFSGFDPGTPGQLSALQPMAPRASPTNNANLAVLCADYAAALLAAGHRDLMKHEYGFARTHAGFALDRRMRRLFRTALIQAENGVEAPPPNPFAEQGAIDFVHWLRATPPDARVPRYLGAVYDDRSDVRGRFPALAGTDREFFLHWVSERGVADAGIPVEMLPEGATGDPRGPSPERRSGLIARMLKRVLARAPRG